VVSTGSTDGGSAEGAPSGETEVSTGAPDEGADSTGGTDGGVAEEPASEERGPRAASGQPGRYQRSASGMIGALIVTLLVILAFVAFRAFNRSDLDVKPQKIDYLAQVHYAQQAGTEVVYPGRLPDGWYATQVRFSPGKQPGLELSMLTGDREYVGFVESPVSPPDLLTTYVDPHPQSGAPVTVDGSVASRWDTWTDSGGDTALVTQRGRGSAQESLLVFGNVSQGQLEELAASLTTSRVAR
jgi:hypothetical protein